MRHDVLIVGAGPTGLVLALWLARLGARPRIVDANEAPTATSRAVAVQARTLELYRQLGLTEALLAEGRKVPALNLWVEGRVKARIPFDTLAENLTPYGPFIFPQDRHERLLIGRLAEMGVAVERQTALTDFAEKDGRVIARLAGPGGEECCEAFFIAGCDGARSRVREIAGAGFPGGTYQQLFYVADVDAQGPAANGELHIGLDDSDFLGVFPLDDAGRARLIGTVRDGRATSAETLQFADVSDRVIRQMALDVRTVNWFSTYHVHHRVANFFRKGRAFLLGDAAHIHSPAGGQGMNTGIGDAINLAWKLRAVLDGRAGDLLLDSYEAERIGFARRLVATTDRLFTLASSEGRLAAAVRTRLVPVIFPAAMRMRRARTYLFKTVSQTALQYRDSPLSRGRAGTVAGGDRLPWAPTAEVDNFTTLREPAWRVHVYGEAGESIRAWCRKHAVALDTFAWRRPYARAGLARDAIYLLRPDTYVGLAVSRQDPALLERYFADQGIRP